MKLDSTKYMWVINICCLVMFVMLTTPVKSDVWTNYDDYDEINFKWVNEEIFMWNSWEPSKMVSGTGPSDVYNFGYTTMINSNYSFCYYYWEDYSLGFTDSEDIGDYELSTSYDSGASLNEFDVQEDFYVFGIARNYTYTMYGSGNYSLDTPCSKVIMVAKFDVDSNFIPEGWMSFQYYEDTTIDQLIPWRLQYPDDYDAKYHTLDSYGWYNSSLIPYMPSLAWVRQESIIYLWDVTEFYNWNVSMMLSSDLYAMWTGKQNCSENPELTFLGFYWEYNITYTPMGYGETNPFLVEDTYIPDADWEDNFSVMLWFSLFYIPVIALTQYIPRIGFVVGVTIMTLIFTTMYLSYLPYTLLTFTMLGLIMYYEG